MLLTEMEASTREQTTTMVPDKMAHDLDNISHDPVSDVTRPPDKSPTSRDSYKVHTGIPLHTIDQSQNTQRVVSPHQSDQSLSDTSGTYHQRVSSDNLDRCSDITMTNDSDQCLGDMNDHNICDDSEIDKSRRSLRHRQRRKNLPERSRQKRQTLQDMTRLLKQWLYHHKNNPYPTKAEKMRLAMDSQLSLTQVSNWFANARRRLKNTVKDPSLSWKTRIKVYNNHVTGNAELLSISSDDSTWESDNEAEARKPDGTQVAASEVNKEQSNPTPTERSQEGRTVSSSVPQTVHSSTQVAPLDRLNFVSQDGQFMQAPPTKWTDSAVLNTGLTVNSLQTDHGQDYGTGQGNVIGTFVNQGQLNPVKSLQDNNGLKSLQDYSGPAVEHSGLCLPKMAPLQTQNHVSFDRPPGASPTKTVSSVEGVIPSVTGSPFSPQQHKPLPSLQCDDITRDGAVSPKYKQTILQRYLHDSYTHSFQIPFSPPSGGGRHRNPSGSVGSHDYEEISSSSRSSPIAMVTGDDVTQDDDLYWLEISAAMALTTLARSRAKHCD